MERGVRCIGSSRRSAWFFGADGDRRGWTSRGLGYFITGGRDVVAVIMMVKEGVRGHRSRGR